MAIDDIEVRDRLLYGDMNGDNAVRFMGQFFIYLGKVLGGWLGGAGMDRIVDQPAVELILADVHPVTVDLITKAHIDRHHGNPHLLDQFFRQVGSAIGNYFYWHINNPPF